MKQRKIIAIVGPTASGKTGWGVGIAREFGGLPALPSAKRWPAGEIISADSRQVYKKLDIGTGKEGIPNEITKFTKIQNYKTEKQSDNLTIQQLEKSIRYIDEIPQWLIDVVSPEESFTMFDWLERARVIIEDIFSRGKLPIVVGGTGLYIQALAEGFELEQSKKLKVKSKKYSRKELEKKSLKQLQNIYFKLKTLNLKLDLQNPHRLIRVIERVQSGEVVSKKKPDFEVLQIAVDLPREVLYRRIDQRVDDWFEQGFIEEVQGLLNSGVDSEWLEKIGLEYRILGNFIIENSLPAGSAKARKIAPKRSRREKLKIENLPGFQEMKQELKFAIHSYARRQLTWFRRFPEIIWRKDLRSAEEEIEKFLV